MLNEICRNNSHSPIVLYHSFFTLPVRISLKLLTSVFLNYAFSPLRMPAITIDLNHQVVCWVLLLSVRV